MVFDTLASTGHEQVIFCQCPDAGLRAVIAIHDTTLGPALGGVRIRSYATEDEAIRDALQLSRTMTYKNALAGLNVGGGKAVILANPDTDKTEALLRAFGRHVDNLGGRYIAAEDVGSNVNDMEQIYLETPYVTGVHQFHGGSGDPAPFTAYGTLQGLLATIRKQFGHEDIDKLSIAVQGLGHIGMEYVKLLKERGAKLFVTDLDNARMERAVQEFEAEAVEPEAIYDVPADVLAPCAMEGTINCATLERLQVKAICGTANNQLASREVSQELHKRGILYAPDYVVNAGGVMNVSLEIDGYNRERAMRLIKMIYQNVTFLFDLSEKENITPMDAANRIAEQRLATIGKLKLPLSRECSRWDRLRNGR